MLVLFSDICREGEIPKDRGGISSVRDDQSNPSLLPEVDVAQAGDVHVDGEVLGHEIEGDEVAGEQTEGGIEEGAAEAEGGGEGGAVDCETGEEKLRKSIAKVADCFSTLLGRLQVQLAVEFENSRNIEKRTLWFIYTSMPKNTDISALNLQEFLSTV